MRIECRILECHIAHVALLRRELLRVGGDRLVVQLVPVDLLLFIVVLV